MKPIFVSRVFWSVAVINLVLVFLMISFTGEPGQIPIARAVAAYHDNPTLERKLALDEAWQSSKRDSVQKSSYFLFAIIVVSIIGGFIAYKKARHRHALEQIKPIERV